MEWPLMTEEEMHTFGIEIILPYIEKEGIEIKLVCDKMDKFPQIVGQRNGAFVYIFVRTECYPGKGHLTKDEYELYLTWAEEHSAVPYFASVGIACASYPDKTEVTTEEDMSLPIRHGGFYVAYPGLELMTRKN